MPWIPRRERCAAAWRARAAAVDELGEGVQERDARASSGGASRGEDAARGQLVGGSGRRVWIAPRCRGFRGESGAALPGGAEAAAVDELGEAYRSATHERAVEALAAEEDAARGQLVGGERTARMDCTAMPWIPRRERCAAAGGRPRLRLWTSSERRTGARRTSEQWRR
ncbi:hypothetical protein TcBrA4_0092860 [Trypanosoma cruzi]|nr:hypothetical protein TcBrA4_0092860 [Trypanosoma cruzi]